MTGLALAVANFEVDIQSNYPKLDPEVHKNAMDDPRNKKNSTNMLRLIILITTLLAVACLVTRHYYKILWLNKYFNQDADTHIYFQFQEIVVGKENETVYRK